MKSEMVNPPCLIAAAERGDMAALARCYSHAALWLSVDGSMPLELAALVVPVLNKLARQTLSQVRS